MNESNLSLVPTGEIRAVLCETVENLLKSKQYQINVNLASQMGENNFMSTVYRITFNKGKNNEAENAKTPSELILKVAPQNETRRTQFYIRPLFLREIYLYDVVLPHFRKLELSKGLAERDCFNEYPKCYRGVDVAPNECVFLEDLSVQQFTTIDRSNGIVTPDHVRLVMNSLGKLHAISFALKDQQPEIFQQFASNIKDETFVRKNDVFFSQHFNKQSAYVWDVVSGVKDAHLLAKLKQLFEKKAMDIAGDCLEQSALEPASVIGHGDTWQNNMMFKYDKNGKPIDVRLLDWQIARCASPIIDIVYFIYSCTTKEVRDLHYENFLKTYHDSLSTHIRRLGSNPEKLFPFELMQKHLNKYARYGLILAICIILPIITSDSGNVVDLDKLAENIKNGIDMDASSFVSENSRIKLYKRVRDGISDMVRLEYI